MSDGPLTCRLCGAAVWRTFVDLGSMPLANSYLEPHQAQDEEPRYPLHARVCDECLLVQVEAVLPAEAIFRDYAYFSSYSPSWIEHARGFAETASGDLGLTGNSLVVEIASNDGYLLRHFQAAGIPVLGIEPAENVARVAVDAGVPTEAVFFGLETAQSLVERNLQADLLVANNVLAHVPDLNDFVAGMAVALKPEGVISIEVPHLLKLIADTQFDTIYHEHFSYFSLLTVESALAAHGLAAFDVEELTTHGGSLRVWAGHQGRAPAPSERLLAMRKTEAVAGIESSEAYSQFAERVHECRGLVVDFLRSAKTGGQTVVAYGAAAKGNTLLNFCDVSVDDIAFVVDRSPHKQGRLLPGTHLPIEDPAKVVEARPDFLLILPWNLRDEIMEQMASIREWGGRFVTPIPRIEVHG